MSFRLLLAEESPTIRRMVELTFAGEPISMVSVGGGSAALQEIAARPPDIVIADAELAAPDGYEVTSFVKRTPELSHIPVILLTAAFEADQARAAEAGCDAVLAKPLDPPELEWKVKRLLRRLAHEQPADVSLADRFDAVDAQLERRETAEGPGAPNGAEGGVGKPPTGFNRPGDQALCATAQSRLPLDDYFDRIDEECLRARDRDLERAFAAFLEAARARPPHDDRR